MLKFGRRPAILLCSLSAVVCLACSTLHEKDFVEVTKRIPGIVLDLRYATENNFTHHRVYERGVCVARRSSVEKLAAAEKDFETEGFRLKLFDCYRPLSVQKKFWALVPDERYVANPAKGSRHNRGAAFDLTLIYNSDAKELDMGTGFDDFTEGAHRDFVGLPVDVTANRKTLENVMVRHGFIGLPTEWWHFDDADWEQYPVEDVAVESVVPSRQ